MYILYEKETGKIISKSEVVPKVTADQACLGDVTITGVDWIKVAVATTSDNLDSVTNVSKITKQDIDYNTMIPVSVESRIASLELRVQKLEKP